MLFHPGGDFDLVYCSEVIEHVPDVGHFVRQLAALVAPGGVLLLTTPDSGHKRVRNDMLHWETVRPPEHLTLFTRAGVRATLAPHFHRVVILPNAKPGVQALAFKKNSPGDMSNCGENVELGVEAQLGGSSERGPHAFSSTRPVALMNTIAGQGSISTALARAQTGAYA